MTPNPLPTRAEYHREHDPTLEADFTHATLLVNQVIARKRSLNDAYDALIKQRLKQQRGGAAKGATP